MASLGADISLPPAFPERRQSAFRKLITKLSEHLQPEDVKKCAFIRTLPKDRTPTALGTLEYLMQVGEFSYTNVEPLIDLLKDVDRHDLVSDLVEPYKNEHPDEISQSLPAGIATHGIPLLERANTVPSELAHSTASHTPLTSAVQEAGDTHMVSSADGLSTQQQPTQLESMFSIHPFLSAELSNQPQSEATVSSQPHGVVYTPVKVHDGPPRMHQSASATSSTDELQRYVRSPSSDDILRSDRRWYARPVASKPLFQQEQPSPLSIQHSSYSSMPMPTGTHTFPRYNSFPRSVKQSTGVSSITATTPPTPLTHHANYALLASRIHRSVTPPAATSKRISVPIELSQTPFRPVSQISGSEAGQPSPPEDDSSWVFQLPQPAGDFEAGTSHTDAGTDHGKLFRRRMGSKRRFLSKLHRFRNRSSSIITWSVKRDKMNEAIYKHRKEKRFKCPYDLELENGGKHPPRLTLYLHPYGDEEDEGNYLTLLVTLSASVKSNIPSSAKIHIVVSARESTEGNRLTDATLECSADCRIVRKKEFLSHEYLKKLECESIDLQVSARLYNNTTS